jgi:hypothetical protein
MPRPMTLYMNFVVAYDFDLTYIWTRITFNGANAKILAHEAFSTALRQR